MIGQFALEGTLTANTFRGAGDCDRYIFRICQEEALTPATIHAMARRSNSPCGPHRQPARPNPRFNSQVQFQSYPTSRLAVLTTGLVEVLCNQSTTHDPISCNHQPTSECDNAVVLDLQGPSKSKNPPRHRREPARRVGNQQWRVSQL